MTSLSFEDIVSFFFESHHMGTRFGRGERDLPVRVFAHVGGSLVRTHRMYPFLRVKSRPSSLAEAPTTCCFAQSAVWTRRGRKVRYRTNMVDIHTTTPLIHLSTASRKKSTSTKSRMLWLWQWHAVCARRVWDTYSFEVKACQNIVCLSVSVCFKFLEQLVRPRLHHGIT